MWCVEVGKEHRDEDGLGRGGPEPGIGCWGLGPLPIGTGTLWRLLAVR